MGFFDDLNAGFDVDQLLEQAEDAERERLQRRLERVEDQLERRHSAYEDERDRLQSRIDSYLSELKTVKGRAFAGSNERREEIQEAVAELYDDLAAVRSRFWNDIQRLQRERRDIREQLEELEASTRLLQTD